MNLWNSLLIILGITISPCQASTVYVGDSISHGFRLANQGVGITKVGANPTLVGHFIEDAPQGDVLVLSTGASNDCKDLKGIKANVDKAQHKYAKVILIDAPYCKITPILLKLCTKDCRLLPITPGKDGIHPATYYKLNSTNLVN